MAEGRGTLTIDIVLAGLEKSGRAMKSCEAHLVSLRCGGYSAQECRVAVVVWNHGWVKGLKVPNDYWADVEPRERFHNLRQASKCILLSGLKAVQYTW